MSSGLAVLIEPNPWADGQLRGLVHGRIIEWQAARGKRVLGRAWAAKEGWAGVSGLPGRTGKAKLSSALRGMKPSLSPTAEKPPVFPVWPARLAGDESLPSGLRSSRGVVSNLVAAQVVRGPGSGPLWSAGLRPGEWSSGKPTRRWRSTALRHPARSQSGPLPRAAAAEVMDCGGRAERRQRIPHAVAPRFPPRSKPAPTRPARSGVAGGRWRTGGPGPPTPASAAGTSHPAPCRPASSASLRARPRTRRGSPPCA